MSDEYKAVLRKLVLKLREVEDSPSYRGIFGMARAHGMEYDGPTYKEEKEEAERLLGLESKEEV